MKRLFTAPDANDEATLWIAESTLDPYPKPLLATSDLRPEHRHLWPAIVDRILAGGPL